MRLYICDHLGAHKTTRVMERWFADRGHEVRYDTYWNPEVMAWCDVSFFAWCEGMAAMALDDAEKYNKPIFIWATDIEIYHRQYNGMKFEKAAGLFYMSKFLFRLMDQDIDFKRNYPRLPIRHLPLVIDTKEWTYKEREFNPNIAVIGEMWAAKTPAMIPQLLHELYKVRPYDKWKVSVLGTWHNDGWRWARVYFDHILKELDIEDKVELIDYVSSVDEWLEDKGTLVTFSQKDAFSLIVGEALAKGIRAFPHNFPGAKAIWNNYVWSSLDELVNKVACHQTDSNKHLEFVKRYDPDIVFGELEKTLMEACHV